MPIFTELPPLSLYIHLPWCVRKCPYCDFNSHEAKTDLPEELYVAALLQNLDHYLALIADRPLISIFFGGGTPSLFSGKSIGQILNGIAERLDLAPQIEITLEANPGTIDQKGFHAFREAGVNRLSLGIQSLQNDKLQALGRIHDADNAMRAITLAREAGFDNFNLDLMYGLPNQSLADALDDLNKALSFSPAHLSWYQLTIEPNTFFYRHTPSLPPDDDLWEMQLAGQEILARAGLQQYEVSAYARQDRQCRHNYNYWSFGDYLGIGAGAHSKLTLASGEVTRFAQVKHPNDYLNPIKRQVEIKILSDRDLMFEFMLNALRLTDGVPLSLFQARTGLSVSQIESVMRTARERGLLLDDDERICASVLGQKFLNDLVGMFL